jgi:6-phosphogluconate dehydrogenase
VEKYAIGLVGLAVMGQNLVLNIERNGYPVAVYNRTFERTQEFLDNGAEGKRIKGCETLQELVDSLESPRKIMLMVQAGNPVDQVIEQLKPLIDKGDLIIDGGNSFYKDSMRRHEELRQRGLHLVDVGTSGGVWGLEGGFSLMVGAEDAPAGRLRPIFEALAPAADKGWAHLGPPGAGHFTKMVHNGIEYGLMQAYAEGFALLGAKEEFDLDLEQVANTWRHGSVVRSWLLDLIERALDAHGPALADIAPHVGDSGMGRWTVQEAIDLDVPAPVLTHALIERIGSRDDVAFYHRLLAALRNQFGGHAMQADKSDEE